jgi:hypothetical protein
MIGYVIAFVILVICIVVPLAAYYFTQMKKDKPNNSPLDSMSPGELLITEEGSFYKEAYQIMPKKEKYIRRPTVHRCHRPDVAEDYCSSYTISDTNGFAYVYDLSLDGHGGYTYTECPGGGHDCWYVEKFDSEGTLTDVVNNNGESLIQKLADDIWGGNWDMENHELTASVKDMFEYTDGKLMVKREGGNNRVSLPGDFRGAEYYVTLFTAMKIAGEEKPTEITVNIKNSRNAFVDERDSWMNTTQG